MSNYPKMLYKGDMKKYSTAIAKNEGEEAELIKGGWLNYIELPEHKPSVGGDPVSEINASAFVPVEHFDALGKENIKLKEELVEALKENQELRQKIRFKEVEDMSADDLRKILDERKIEYGARDGKPTLINLVIESEK